MNLEDVRTNLEQNNIFHASDPLPDYPSLAGYDKQFRWSWMATQLNTFYVIAEVEEELSVVKLEELLQTSFQYAEKHYNGWPRGLQSGIGVILIIITPNPSSEVQLFTVI